MRKKDLGGGGPESGLHVNHGTLERKFGVLHLDILLVSKVGQDMSEHNLYWAVHTGPEGHCLSTLHRD